MRVWFHKDSGTTLCMGVATRPLPGLCRAFLAQTSRYISWSGCLWQWGANGPLTPPGGYTMSRSLPRRGASTAVGQSSAASPYTGGTHPGV